MSSPDRSSNQRVSGLDPICSILNKGPYFTKHSQEHSLSFSPKFGTFECNTTSDRLNRMVTRTYGLANQKLCCIQMLLNIEKSGEQD